MVFFIVRKFFNMPGNFKMSDVKIRPSHDLLRFILQATTMLGAHRNFVVLLKISVSEVHKQWGNEKRECVCLSLGLDLALEL